MRTKQVGAFVADRHGAEVHQRPHEEAARDEQDERHADLDRHERLAHAASRTGRSTD